MRLFEELGWGLSGVDGVSEERENTEILPLRLRSGSE